MKYRIESDSINIIGDNCDLTIYSTVDLDVVLYASDSSYMECFNSNSYSDEERNIYRDIDDMICNANSIKKDDNDLIDIGDKSVTFYSSDKKCLLTFFSNDGIVTMLLTRIHNICKDEECNAKIEFKHDGSNGYDLLYPILSNALFRYSKNNEKIYQKKI